MDSPKVINFILEREKLKAGTFAKENRRSNPYTDLRFAVR